MLHTLIETDADAGRVLLQSRRGMLSVKSAARTAKRKPVKYSLLLVKQLVVPVGIDTTARKWL